MDSKRVKSWMCCTDHQNHRSAAIRWGTTRKWWRKVFPSESFLLISSIFGLFLWNLDWAHL